MPLRLYPPHYDFISCHLPSVTSLSSFVAIVEELEQQVAVLAALELIRLLSHLSSYSSLLEWQEEVLKVEPIVVRVGLPGVEVRLAFLVSMVQ